MVIDQKKHKITLVALAAVLLVLVGSGLYVFYDLNDDSLDFRDSEVRLVVTGSMDAGETDNPISTIPINSLIVVRHLNSDEINFIEVGDVIAYDRGGKMIVHRVVEIKTSVEDIYFITQGDANSNVDSTPVYPADVIGEIIGVSPFLGKFVSLTKDKAAWIIIFIACAVVAVYSVREIFRIYIEEDEDDSSSR